MGDVIDFTTPSGSPPIIVTNHMVDLDDDLMPVTKGLSTRKWYGVVSVHFDMGSDTTTMTLLAAFLSKKHAESFRDNLSPGQPADYLDNDVIRTIQLGLEGESESDEHH